MIFEGFAKFWSDYRNSGLWATLSINEQVESKRAAWCAWKAAIELTKSEIESLLID